MVFDPLSQKYIQFELCVAAQGFYNVSYKIIVCSRKFYNGFIVFHLQANFYNLFPNSVRFLDTTRRNKNTFFSISEKEIMHTYENPY